MIALVLPSGGGEPFPGRCADHEIPAEHGSVAYVDFVLVTLEELLKKVR